MSGDYRFFIKVHNGFPEHRKTVGLSDRAFRRLVEVWCYCSRNLNDGQLTDAQVSQLFSQKVRDELVAAGYLHQGDSGWEMNDYLGHQMSAAEVADLREKRALAGRRGGNAKAKALASAMAKGKQTGSKDLPDKDVDKDVDLEEENTGSHVSNASEPDHTVESEPRSKPIAPNINRLSKRYTTIVRLSDPGKVCAVILNAVGAGFHETQIGDALERLAHADMPVTADTLRIEINGRSTNGHASPHTNGRTLSTGEQRAMAAVDAANQVIASRQGSHTQPQIGAE